MGRNSVGVEYGSNDVVRGWTGETKTEQGVVDTRRVMSLTTR